MDKCLENISVNFTAQPPEAINRVIEMKTSTRNITVDADTKKSNKKKGWDRVGRMSVSLQPCIH